MMDNTKLITHMESNNIRFPSPIALDNYSSFQRSGKNNEYWLNIINDDLAIYGNWKTGEKYNYFSGDIQKRTPEEKKELKIKIESQKLIYQKEILEAQEKTARKAERSYSKASSQGFSEYLKNKKLEELKQIKFQNNNLLIPLYDTNGKIWNLQTIYPNGTKRFLKNGKKKGCFYIFGFNQFHKSNYVFVGEGFSTCASIYLASNIPIISCFDAGNIEPVVKEIKLKYPQKKYIILADDDCYSHINIGRKKAIKTATKHNLPAYIPIFQDKSSKPTDFNDLHTLEGLEAVRKQLKMVKWI